MNVNDTSAIRACTSCQMCGAVCPMGAIAIALNEDGFYRPVIDVEKCIDCSLCVRSCYKFDDTIRITEDVNKYNLIAAWAKNSDVRRQTTSGGIADVMVRELISQGYKCVGVGYDTKHNCAKGCVAETVEQTVAFRGSKYIQSLSVDAFKEVVKESKTQKYAVFGLPCQIYAIDRYLRTRGCRDSHLLVDLYCHGCPSLNVWKKYINEIVAKHNAKSVLSVNFRSKVRGWGNFYVVVVVEGVSYPIEVVSPRIKDGFYEMFFSDLVLNDSCPDCELRSTLEYADIRLGDFWGKSYVMNHQGVSAVTVMTEHGGRIMDSIKPLLEKHSQTFNNFLPYQSYGKTYRVNREKRQKLLSALSDENVPLSRIVNMYVSMLSSRARLKRFAKNIVKLAPNGLISVIKLRVYSRK